MYCMYCIAKICSLFRLSGLCGRRAQHKLGLFWKWLYNRKGLLDPPHIKMVCTHENDKKSSAHTLFFMCSTTRRSRLKRHRVLSKILWEMRSVPHQQCSGLRLVPQPTCYVRSHWSSASSPPPSPGTTIHTCRHKHININIRVCKCVHTHLHTCMYMHIYIYIYIFIYM